MGTKRLRGRHPSGRDAVSKSHARSREEAELLRITKAIAEIPRYSNRFQLFRTNRRQKAKKLADSQATSAASLQDLPIFRAQRFSELPLSGRTLDGLAASNFTELTGIQKSSIPQALAGRDVLAAAPTGSGKTLAFLVPLLEILWRNKWNTVDGLGALILAPTRELGMQIFEVLRSVARKHTISAGLVIGGKDFESEREKVGNMNVLVATPGRILHHMDHVAELDCSTLKLLVLDEADRILDMGFAKTLDAILQNLPKERQTLLYSATQTKSVKALARLSLKEPEYVAVANRQITEEKNGENTAKEDATNDEANSVKIMGTPTGLSQSYVVVPAHEKLSVLWSFIKTHLKSKMIIFFASGKQVRFAFETFCKLRPGMSLLHIHGGMKQLKRTDMYDIFCRTSSAALFATDVASRGLDFPDVEWVIQVDCPDDVGTYVHRVGRTARFKAQGRAMLFLNEGKEETFLERLKARKLELHKTRINPNKIQSIEPKIAATVAANQELKNLAQRAFKFYIKSIYQQGDKEVFDVTDLDYALLGKSFGLSIAPRVAFNTDPRVLQNQPLKKEKSKTVFGYRIRAEKERLEDESGEGDDDAEKNMRRKKPQEDDSSSEEDDVLRIKKVHAAEDEMDDDELQQVKEERNVTRKRKKRKLDLLKSMPSANRIVFTEDGEAIRAGDLHDTDSDDDGEHADIEDYAATVAKRLEATAEEDKTRERDRVRAMHARQREKRRGLQKITTPASTVVAMVDESMDSDASGFSSSEKDAEEVSEQSDSESEQMDGDRTLEDEERLALEILQSRR